MGVNLSTLQGSKKLQNKLKSWIYEAHKINTNKTKYKTNYEYSRIWLDILRQRIAKVHKSVEQNLYWISKQFVHKVEANESLQNAEKDTRYHDRLNIINSLQSSVHRVLIVTLPPTPKIPYKKELWTKMDKYNKHVLSLNNKKKLECWGHSFTIK